MALHMEMGGSGLAADETVCVRVCTWHGFRRLYCGIDLVHLGDRSIKDYIASASLELIC